MAHEKPPEQPKALTQKQAIAMVEAMRELAQSDHRFAAIVRAMDAAEEQPPKDPPKV